MATSSSTVTLGSSSIDVASIVTNLVNNKRAAKDSQISTAQTSTSTQISAIGNFTSSLTSLQAAIKSLTDGTAFSTLKTSIGDSTVLSATTDSTAKANVYNIAVTQLATSQKTTSGAFASARTTEVGTGTLSIAVGDKSMSVDIASPANTLQDVRDAINNSKSNPGVTASIVTGTDGAHLVLTSQTTGAANAFTVTSSGGDGGLAQLDFDPATDTPTIKAQDALFTVDGTAASSPTNTTSTAIDGVTLSLAKTGSSSITISNDTSSVSTAMQSLVTAYNSFVSTYSTLTKYDATNQQVGALIGDATVNSIKSQVSQLLGSQLTGATASPRSLSDLGVSFQVDGTLKFDTTKLTSALSSNPSGVKDLLSGTNGIAPKLDKLVTGWTSSSGILTQRTTNLNAKLKDLADQQTAWDSTMTDYTKRLTTQYTALDTMMTKLSSTSSYLTQQFDALTKSS
ncbi:flagellar filament capping protein FliD [Dyella sp. 333MFSha]|uniref:flagellar filament capping protein FliD n=1 Tax=Dyella sp. 333MFSha TaxID=1798240 RepID=UPI000888B5AF|nr:flagellar filament capping protein FliD [Dyella sp. 333MFSha]SDF09362.1 flagellar hook-associated protein 2 [Dyella sp. 333MFSha]